VLVNTFRLLDAGFTKKNLVFPFDIFDARDTCINSAAAMHVT
jgi:hypothetical protein